MLNYHLVSIIWQLWWWCCLIIMVLQ